MSKGLYSKTHQQVDSTPTSDRKKLRFLNSSRPSKDEVSFVWNALRGLRPFQYDLKPSSRSVNTTPLAKEFFGVGVAEPMDGAACQSGLELIEELGVGSVRLDYTYGQDSSLLDDFVDGLSAMGVDVLLHLVQPIEAASRMEESAAVSEWRSFMEGALQRFSGKITAIEVATTINRAKWSGYSLKGFLALWEISHEVAESNGITLVGPNITDFEPQYNAGVLAMLAGKKQLPEIHSTNLFAERAIEPEGFDRKILGPSLARYHKFDLRKKIRLIAAIATKHGISRNWSTCAFWTLPRISRWLAWPEEQMADYLTRYFVLCAGVGSFERIYWGPLISFREGLVDDSTFIRSDDDPSARDVVSFYSNFLGEPEKWRCRPAYTALRALCVELVGAVYKESFCVSASNGMEAHAFDKEGQAIYVLWTRNGQYARLADCFSSEDIEAVEHASDRDGARSSIAPAFFGQSPIYLCWPSGHQPQLLTGAAPIKSLVVARPDAGFDYYDYNEGDWRGLIRAESAEDAKTLAAALSPTAIAQNAEVGSLRKARNAIWTVEDPRNADRLLVVKKPVRMAWHKRILDRNRPSKALRSWNGTSQLMRRGINTPKVVAYFESKVEGDMMNNWFICEHFESKLNVRGFFSQYAEGAEEVEGITFETFAHELVDFVFRMHLTGIFFRDLAGGNVLVDIKEDSEIVFSLIDTARIRSIPWAIKKSQRIADLKRLVLKLNSEQQIYFMNHYLKRMKGRFSVLNQISFKLFAFKVYLKRIKRRMRKKLST